MADFAYKPDYGYKVKPAYNVLRSSFENKVEQTRLKTSKKLRFYELPFTNRKTDELTAVKTLFDTKKGNLNSMTIDIEGEEVTGRIVEDTFFYERVNPNVWNYGFNFQEIP